MFARSWRFMKFGTNQLLPAVLLIASAYAGARIENLDGFVRQAALDHGLRPASQLFDATDSNLAEAGGVFFRSTNLSLNGDMACETCHLAQFSSADGLPNAVGVFGEGEGRTRAHSGGMIVPRNTLPLWGRGGVGFNVFFWDGRIDFANAKPLTPFGDVAPSSDPLVVAAHLPPIEIREMIVDDDDVSRYKGESTKHANALHQRIVSHLVARESDAVQQLAEQLRKRAGELTFGDVARSIAAFIRQEFRMRDTKLHEHVFGTGDLSERELQGAIVFYGKGKCANCHTGPYFSDLRFHAVPLPQLGFGKNGFGIDYGRFNVTFTPDDLYRFRTPPLINVAETRPYGHAGSLPTVRDAITAHFDPLRFVQPASMDLIQRHEFFRRMASVSDGFKLIGLLTESEVDQVTAFLETLSFSDSSH